MEQTNVSGHSICSVLSLDPLLAFWRARVAPQCAYLAEMFNTFEQRILHNEELSGDIQGPEVIEKYKEIIFPLMTAAFPTSTWETSIAGALTPLSKHPFFYTPMFERVLMTEDRQVRGRLKQPEQDFERYRRLRAFWLVLDKIYGIGHGRSTPVIRVVVDPQTGLERYFRILPDWQFLEVETAGQVIPLNDEQRHRILDHIDDPDMLAKLIPVQQFIFRGFIIIRAVDVTESEVFLDMEKDLIDQESTFCTSGFGRLQRRLQTLFGRPDLSVGMGALQRDQVWVIHNEEPAANNCMFKNSNHIPLSELKGSIWLQAVSKGDMLIVSDLADAKALCPAEEELVKDGVRSVLILPLRYRGTVIGTFFIMSPRPNDFTAMDKILIKPIAPLFSVALKRGVDDVNNEVQTIIKEKCTALHPSVEWRFRKAAFRHMERMHSGQPSEMEPIVFKDVIPLFGQSDIRGSSEARSQSIQADLTEQLELANEVLRRAEMAKPWPLIKELQHRIDKRVENLGQGVFTGAETLIGQFLSREVEPVFDELLRLGPRVVQAIEKYRRALDPQRGFVYHRRKDYEDSVSILNDRLSAYLDREESEAQKEYPHYFEKHQTDGFDYVIYLGASMHEDGNYNRFHLQNLLLWQLTLACGMAWHTEQVKPRLAVPLDTCHLVLYNTTPLSIRFRYDEKRFDIDGAYDVRNEIIKSRLDKAVIKNGERLTQPGRLAVVYSQPQELRELRRHMRYLQATGHLADDIEALELEDLPNVRGLKALRVGINLQARVLAEKAAQAAVG